jgi:hypothetical protein
MTIPAGLALSYRRVFVCATTGSVYEFLGRDTRFLLDTNFIIGMLKDDPAIAELVRERGMVLVECAYSSITRMELLGLSRYNRQTRTSDYWPAFDLDLFGDHVGSGGGNHPAAACLQGKAT